MARMISLTIIGLILHGLGYLVLSGFGASGAASAFGPLFVSGWLLIPGGILTAVAAVRYALLKPDLPRRRAMWQVWNNLYFCARDDVAFVPGGSPFHPSQLPGFMATTTGPFAGIVTVRA
ncbi:hypothetical protein [Nocardia sp. NPDC051832]|uniref:hypothetical protein n=1 Tax=Nocardia sp. NPDC051832 TaxID=3155673 RepID=UPI0034127C2E